MTLITEKMTFKTEEFHNIHNIIFFIMSLIYIFVFLIGVLTGYLIAK